MSEVGRPARGEPRAFYRLRRERLVNQPLLFALGSRCSRSTTHYSLLTTRHPPLATHHPPLSSVVDVLYFIASLADGTTACACYGKAGDGTTACAYYAQSLIPNP
jgi:hypothetical protein